MMVSMLIFGSANTIIQSLQNQAEGDKNYFTHPYFQTAIMFTGEFSVFLAYGVKKWKLARDVAKNPDQANMLLSPGTQQASEKKLKMNPNPLLLAIPAAFDCTASTLMFIALTMVPPSVYQMMRGFINVVTPFMTIFFLKKKQYAHHWLGVISIVLGVAGVGVVALFEDSDSDSDSGGSIGLGIILILVAQFFAGGLFVVEEYLLGDYYLDPLKVVGLEGMFGLSYCLVMLPIMQAVRCDGDKLCQFGYVENSSYAFYQMADNGIIILLSFGIMLSIAAYNVSGITTTKVASAAQRATIDTSRTLTVWLVSLALGLEKDFYWQSIFGFIFLVFGTLVYNEVVVLPFCGLD
mmetsp:Transcript_11349/g.15267  ORF Transcript_11349/g.15267 Transcript_11349/m.15267 type:complete len:350 (-) Transcript_11349:262-1311(-)|eukprot:CAMPEP_0185582894 /NCGR_PEP_ID=MMETSP0434-20130131/21192_1 /TAXON_ID=626734 ORGANISM="Favella taraikaensis, Strain Fe Narragansett Bay" /NCGR_SAMPLE_ID=MMETSP0434 /ASSEMBLY_ACC=CAM_ASM_000379 /LENGTH=349 /DNA_ID=CAMNT_0028201845 /DNA_START=76 /DNA_END=1125 /DNA_ORIENTATION=-